MLLKLAQRSDKVTARIGRGAQHLCVHIQFSRIQQFEPNLRATLGTRPEPDGAAVAHDVLALKYALTEWRLVAPRTVYARLLLG